MKHGQWDSGKVQERFEVEVCLRLYLLKAFNVTSLAEHYSGRECELEIAFEKYEKRRRRS